MSPRVRTLVDRQGVALTELAFTRDMGWIFREQPISDVGVDAVVEVVSDGVATGDLLALQLKSGDSFFNETTDEGFVYRGDSDHLEYWKRYAAPVVLVLCRPSCDRCWWQVIDSTSIAVTGTGWKIIVPTANELGSDSREPLQRFVKAWRASRFLQVIREFAQNPLGSDLAAHTGELINPWIRDMDTVAQGCLFWGIDVAQYYSCTRLNWLESNMLLRGLLWCMNLLVRWSPIDLNQRLAKFAFVAHAIRYSAFHILGIAGLDIEAEEQGLPPYYAFVIQPDHEQRKMLTTLYEYLKETHSEVERHLTLKLTSTQEAMAKQALQAVVEASNSGVFNFVDYPELRALGWVGQDWLRGATDRVAEEIRIIETRWRGVLKPPKLSTLEQVKATLPNREARSKPDQ